MMLITSSSPVEMIAAFTSPPTVTSPKPCDANRAIVAVRIRSPFARVLWPFARSQPHPPHEIAKIDIDIYDDLRAIARHVLLHYDGVCRLRQWRAGKNPDRFTRRNAELSIAARRLFANHTQALALLA